MAHEVYFLESVVPQPLTPGLLLSLPQQLTHLDMCRGSRVRTETTMDNTLQFTHHPYLKPNQEPHGVTLVKLDAFGSLSNFFWKSDLAKRGTNGVRQL